jgi:PhnB protein
MAERNQIERLDDAVEAILAGQREGLPLADPDLATLLLIAADLRDLPAPGFKAGLKAELIPSAAKEPDEEETMSTTAVKNIRPGFHSITPYLIVDGAADFMAFANQAFGAQETFRVPRPDGGIMHAEIRIGDSMIEVADFTAEHGPNVTGIHLYIDEADAAYARALAAGATSLGEPTDQPYGDREATVKDRWGNHWYLATHQENVSEEEMAKRFATPGWKPNKSAAVGVKPMGFRTVTPFLHPQGTGKFLDFLRQAFDAIEVERTAGPEGSVMHATVRIGDSMLEMGEAHGAWQPTPCMLHLYVDDTDAFYERAIAAGATSLDPPADRPYGERNAGVTDPIGNAWFIATPK